MEELKNMKQMLVGCVQGQMSNIAGADYEELGAAIDMIKDLSEAMYYCTITEAMEGKEKEKEHYYYETRYYPVDRDMDRDNGRMYYPGYNTIGGNGNGRGNSSNGNNSGSRYYTEYEPMNRIDMRDRREGRSPRSRRMYMEAKEMNQDSMVKMKELENYMQELTSDITEMIQDASPEEKQMLQKKIATLATKINV